MVFLGVDSFLPGAIFVISGTVMYPPKWWKNSHFLQRLQRKQSCDTLPETNSKRTWNLMVCSDDPASFWGVNGLFSGPNLLLVSGSVNMAGRRMLSAVQIATKLGTKNTRQSGKVGGCLKYLCLHFLKFRNVGTWSNLAKKSFQLGGNSPGIYHLVCAPTSLEVYPVLRLCPISYSYAYLKVKLEMPRIQQICWFFMLNVVFLLNCESNDTHYVRYTSMSVWCVYFGE